MALSEPTFRETVRLITPLMDERRHTIVPSAFYGQVNLLGNIQYTGAAGEFAIRLVRLSDEFGTLDKGEYAVVALLEECKLQLGPSKQRIFDDLIATVRKELAGERNVDDDNGVADNGQRDTASTEPTASGGGDGEDHNGRNANGASPPGEAPSNGGFKASWLSCGLMVALVTLVVAVLTLAVTFVTLGPEEFEIQVFCRLVSCPTETPTPTLTPTPTPTPTPTLPSVTITETVTPTNSEPATPTVTMTMSIVPLQENLSLIWDSTSLMILVEPTSVISLNTLCLQVIDPPMGYIPCLGDYQHVQTSSGTLLDRIVEPLCIYFYIGDPNPPAFCRDVSDSGYIPIDILWNSIFWTDPLVLSNLKNIEVYNNQTLIETCNAAAQSFGCPVAWPVLPN